MTIRKPLTAAAAKAALAKLNSNAGQVLALQALEPRIAFDAAAVAVAADVIVDNTSAAAPAAAIPGADAGHVDQAGQDHGAALFDALAAAGDMAADSAASGSQIVFIDGNVRDPGVIAAAIPDGAEVVMLDTGRDGIAQIADYLDGRSGVSAVHFVSHGAPGEVTLGGVKLDAASIAGHHADDLAVIRAALSDTADILFYGCDVAQGADGAAFLADLSNATGADVAASTDDTGYAEAGGDWDLEARVGRIEAALIDAPEWNGLLAPLVISVSSAPIVTGTGAVGTTALWTNAGTLGGSPIDLRATVTSLTTLSGLPFFGTAGDDAFFQLTNQGNATLRWEIFATGTNQTVYAVGTPEFRVADVDGVGNVPYSRESVQPGLNSLTSYTLSNPTNLVAIVAPSGVQVSGTLDQNGESTSLVGFTWSEVSSWDVQYTLHLNQAGIQARFLHDGDGDFTFVAPNTSYLLGIDLDADNSFALGTAYQTDYVEGASGVPVVDTDVAITQNVALGTNLHAASVVLTNAQSGDLLLVNGSSNASGIVNGLNYTLASSGGQITVTLSGTATPTEYQTALAAITFANTSDSPSVVDRNVTVSVSNATFETTSNVAIATIKVIPVNDPPIANDNTSTVIEDTPAIGNVITDVPGADSTVEAGETLTLTQFTVAGVPGAFTPGQLATIPGVGTLTMATTGVYTFTPAPGYTGPIPVTTYTITDGNGGTDTATLTLTITPVDDPLGFTGLDNGPVGSGTDAAVEESDLPTGSTPAGTGENATGTFTLVPGDGLASLSVGGGTPITAVALAAATPAAPITVTGTNGTLSITGYDPVTGVVSYGYTLTSSADHTGGPGTDPFTLTITDADADTASATLAILIVDDVPAAANDTASVTEDGTTTATGNLVTTNDVIGADVRPTPVTGVVSGINAPAGTGANIGTGIAGTHGTLTLNADGSYTYTINNSSDAVQGLALGETINDVFTYEITDADGDTSTATLTVAIVGANDTPVVVDPTNPGTPENPIPAADPQNVIPDVSTVDSATPPPLDVSDYIVDPDGDPLTFTATGLPPGLTLDPVTGIISGTLPSDASQGGPGGDGIYTITVTATDPHNATTTTTVTYTVTNPPPVAVDDVGMVTEDIPATGNVLTDGTDDSDPDGDALTVTGFEVGGTTYTPGQTPTLPGVGTLTIGTDGVYTFTPSSNYTGAIPVVTYTISDGEGGSDTATLTLTMVPVNDAPVVIDPTDPGTPLNPKEPADPDNIIPDITTVDSATPPTVDVSDYIADPEGNPLTYTATGLPTGLTLDPVTGIISGTLPADASQGGPNADGVYPVVVTVTDTGGLSTTTTITYTVTNPSPVAVDDVGTVTEDIPAIGNVLTDGTPDSDPDGDDLTVTAFEVGGTSYTPGQTATLPGVGTLTIGTNGVYTFTPALNFTGSIPLVTYTISDGEGGDDTATLNLSMIAVNDPPIAVDDANSVGEDAASVAGNVITGPGTDTDIDSPVLTVVSATEGATPLVIGQPFTTAGGGVLTLFADGSYTFAPGTAYNGLDAGETESETIIYTVSDGNGATDTAQLVITIIGSNDTPVIIDPTNPVNIPGDPLYDPENPAQATDPLNIIPDVSRTDGQPLDPIPVADFVRDPDGEPLTFAVDPTTTPSWIVIDPVTGVITGTPPANASQDTNTGNPGEYLVTIIATDPDGTVATTTVTLTIANVPPVAQDDLGTTPENTPLTGNVLVDNGFGVDVDGGPDTDPVRVGGVITGTATPVDGVGLSTPVAGDNDGTFTVEPNGDYVFEPGTAFDDLAPGETRTTTVTYVIYDDSGDSDTATLTVTVTGENDAPTAIDPTTGLPPVDPVTGQPVDPTVVSIIPLIPGSDSTPITPVSIADYFGDVDVSQGPPALMVDPTALPPGITFDPATGTFSGTPTPDASQGGNVPGQPGVYRVPVTATDPEGASVTTFVTFTISNPPPVAVTNVDIVTDENVAITFPVLGNDNDPDGDTIRVISASSPNGNVTVNPDGTISFEPNPGFAGTALVTYTITDDQGGFSTAVAEIFVRANGYVAPPAPIAPPIAGLPPFAPLPGADGAVGLAANGLNGVRGDGIGANGAVLGAVEGSEAPGGLFDQDRSLSLDGVPAFIAADGAVLQESARINRLWTPEAIVADRTGFGRWDVEPIGGFSLQFGMAETVGAETRFVIESLVRDGVLILTFDDRNSGRSGSEVVDYRVTRADGRALPGWLERPAVDQLTGRRPVDAETIDLKVTAIMADGTEASQSVRIQGPTGEIQPLKDRRADVIPLFKDQFASGEHLSDNEAAELAALLTLPIMTAAE